MQIGWCTLATPFTRDGGVGDDETSYAYDGFRVKKWHVDSLDYGEQWAVGDVIGSLLDLNTKEITFYRNDKDLGVAFKGIKTGPNMAYFPAMFMSEGTQAILNFGQRPFRHRLDS
jgi:Kip1 ubiquitination-promoting complex protein 1